MLLGAAALGQALSAAPVDFARDIRPVFSDRCFACHGPDEATRKVGLRLDTETGLRTPRGQHIPVVPGNPAASEVMKRIAPQNPAMRMPPSWSGQKPLTAREVDLIREWIAQGAKWQSHWSFVAPQRPSLPQVKNGKWIRNPIDLFVLARLEREGLTPAPEADRARLLRRVTLDLTGLPPTLAELDAYLADRSPDAYEKVVDRLLASPRYGERMAVDWLDAARYADSHGYQVDPEKEMWAWRDWVINAFNRNMPYDRFTVEQLAGDLLPKATLEQKIATGFQRNHRINSETGSIAEEFQTENVVDRVSTTGAVWLGLTVGCARCHDHKFDPISAREFYSMYAFFNNVDEVGNGGPRDGRGNHKPYLQLPAPELEKQLAAKDVEIAAVRKELTGVEEKVAAGQAEWEKGALAFRPAWEPLRIVEAKAEDGVTLEVLPDGSIRSGGKHADTSIYEITVETKVAGITGFRFDLVPDPAFPGGGSGRGRNGKGVATLFELRRNDRKIDLARITADYASEESEINLVLRPMEQLKRGWAVDPEFNKPHFSVIEPSRVLEAGRYTIRIGNEYGEGALIGRFRLSVTPSEFPEVMPQNIAKILGTEAAKRSEADRRELRRYYVSHPRERRAVAEKVAQLEGERRAIDNRISSTMVMHEMDTPRDTFLLTRGQYDKPGTKVEPGVPAFLPPLPAGAPKNRLSLARWLVDPANPLTARVAVNRYWQAYLGAGLVRTPEDFGSQGEQPTHPELLDWLATEFVAKGWDVKAMQKLIVMSATYRQSSIASPALRERDPENRLLARGPRVRLQAEIIRDQALAISGLLTEKIGGPSVKTYQPEGLWEQLSAFQGRKLYVRSKGPDLWRRSLYTFWKRTVPPPSLTTFDAPTREFCVIKRPMSSTPLQALALLNDEMYVEMSRKLAERMMKEGGASAGDRIGWALRLATARTPKPAEVDVLRLGLERRLGELRAHPQSAEKMLSAGEAPRDKNIDPVELAAYATTAAVILNLDEVITRQ
jgi:hypothetical protein